MSYNSALFGDIKLPDTVHQLQTVEFFSNTVFPPTEFSQAHFNTEFFKESMYFSSTKQHLRRVEYESYR